MANITGIAHIPHDKTFFGDRLAVPNQITPIWWQFLPPNTVWSAPMMEFDAISVGQRDASLSESIRSFIDSLSIPGVSFEDGANDFIKQGYFDLQGWLVSYDQPLVDSFTDATPEQIVDDYIRKVPVPYVERGTQITADEQLQTLRESIGEGAADGSTPITAEGQDAVLTPDDSRDGLATKHPAVIEQASMFDIGPRMFFEKRVYLGTRHANAIPVGENQQRYTAYVSTDINGIQAAGKYAIVIFTVSMPHLNAFGTPNDEKDEPLSPYDDFVEFMMTYNRVPLEHMEMMDEISIANARYRFRQDMQNDASQAENAPQTGLWGIGGGFEKYIQEKRQYSVKQGMWEQKPLMFSIRVNHTLNVPFVLVPNRM